MNSGLETSGSLLAVLNCAGKRSNDYADCLCNYELDCKGIFTTIGVLLCS